MLFLDTKALEEALAFAKRVNEAEELMKPVDQMIGTGEKAILNALKEKAPGLVEPMRAVQSLHLMMEHFIKGEFVHPEHVTHYMNIVQEFVMNATLDKREPRV